MAKANKHPLLESYKAMRQVNQFIKSLSDVYVIDGGGAIYMPQDPELSVERVAILDSTFNEKVYPYMDKLINAPKFFEFSRDTKVANLDIVVRDHPHITGEKVHTIIDRTSDMAYQLIPYLRSPNPYSIGEILKLKFYKALFTQEPFDRIFYLIKDMDEADLSCEDGRVADILGENLPVSMSYNGNMITLVKNMFPNIKKVESLEAKMIHDMDDRFYMLFKETYDFITVYTLAAYLKVAE